MAGSRKPSSKLTQDSVKFVLYNNSTHASWRATPSDPYIYISFSKKQYQQAYGDDRLALMLLEKPSSAEDFSTSHIGEIKQLIDREWISKCELPIRFLDPSISPTEMRKKNIYYILSIKVSEKVEKNSEVKISTLSLTYPINKNFKKTVPAHFKLTKFPKKLNLKNDDIYIILHESAHALIGLKHFKPYDKTDKPPYNDKLTCLDSVMSYEETCPPVLQKEYELLGNHEISRFDPDPKVQKIISQIVEAYPTHLGPLDILAAKEFKRSWQDRNVKSMKKSEKKKVLKNQEQFNSQDDNHPPHQDLITTRTSFGGFLNRSFDMLIMSMINYSSSVVQDCPSYFPPQNLITKNSNFLFHKKSTGNLFALAINTTCNAPPLLMPNNLSIGPR